MDIERIGFWEGDDFPAEDKRSIIEKHFGTDPEMIRIDPRNVADECNEDCLLHSFYLTNGMICCKTWAAQEVK